MKSTWILLSLLFAMSLFSGHTTATADTQNHPWGSYYGTGKTYQNNPASSCYWFELYPVGPCHKGVWSDTNSNGSGTGTAVEQNSWHFYWYCIYDCLDPYYTQYDYDYVEEGTYSDISHYYAGWLGYQDVDVIGWAAHWNLAFGSYWITSDGY